MPQKTIVGLFAGIGGIELGFLTAGFRSVLLCETDPGAVAVLKSRFADAQIVGDVADVTNPPKADVITAGFPCQDLSQAGRTAGIAGERSGLVGHVFRLLEANDPEWVVLENVPFMLSLDRGAAMHYLVRTLANLGFRWAYRVVDTRAFGLPQRRLRVIVVASRRRDPRAVLFADNAEPREFTDYQVRANGFYWTEGTRGLGWAVNAVPTLKGGSTIGIPSPPAIWMPDGSIVKPDVRDAERLQGFEADWTLPAVEAGSRAGVRWKLVGNAVSVPVFRWVAERLVEPGDPETEYRSMTGSRWPIAACGDSGGMFDVAVTRWPTRRRYRNLAAFLSFDPEPLSRRATAGFLSRAESSNLRFVSGFLPAIRRHLARLERVRTR